MKKIRCLSLGIGLIAAAAVIITSGVSSYFQFNASEAPAWKHFAAVMPTATTQGIREYWIDCVSEKTPHFTEPTGVPIGEATLTKEQKEAILANPKDERIIPTLNLIQSGVTKATTGESALDYTFVYDAYAYNYLDSTTKGLISGANVDAINAAYQAFNATFTVVYDARKDLVPYVEQDGVSIKKGYDATYGDVLEITTELGNAGGTSQPYFYGLERSGVTYSENDILNFAVYSPFAAQANTSQTYWIGAYGTAKKITANPTAWTNIVGKGNELNSDGKVATVFNQAISLQRYVNGTIDPYTGTYKMTSVVIEKAPTAEGATVLKGANNITNIHTWDSKNPDTTVISYNVDTQYGKATQVDIKTKTTVLELEWKGFNKSKIANFDYVRFYVFAKTTQRVFVSLESWRNKVVSLLGVEPFAKDNDTQANTVQGIANVVADQWNTIDIPVSYLEQDTDGKIFIEIWEDRNEAKDGWLFTDMVGHYATCVVDNGGQLIAHNTSATVAPVTDADLGACSRVTLAATRGYAKQNRSIDISGFINIEFKVKNESAASMKFLLYMIASGIYANTAPIGKYVEIQVNAGETKTVEYSIANYFGTNASASSIMFAVDGTVGNTFLFSTISGRINSGEHKHTYGSLISATKPTCVLDGTIAHYHCAECGKDFDENKKEVESIVVPATGHHYEIDNDNYVCSTCGTSIKKAEELVIKKEKQTKQYIFLGSSICNGYHGPGLECTSMADFFRNDYLLATYTALRNGKQVTETNVYLRRITDKSTLSEPFLGVYSYDFDKVELRTGGVGLFNNTEFSYSLTDGRLIINEPASYLYKFNAVFYGKDNVIKKASNGFSLSDKQPRWATPTQEVTDRHSYVGLMEELVSQYSELDVDEFVVQLSTNDMGLYCDQACTTHLPFGEVTADDVKDITKFDKDTSFGALEWIVAKAKEVWGCKVTIFTCQMYDADYAIYKNNGYDLNSLKTSSYFKMYEPTLQVAKKWGTGLIDIYANKEAEIKLNENKNRYKADAVHLTEIGYEAVLYQIFKAFYDAN